MLLVKNPEMGKSMEIPLRYFLQLKELLEKIHQGWLEYVILISIDLQELGFINILYLPFPTNMIEPNHIIWFTSPRKLYPAKDLMIARCDLIFTWVYFGIQMSNQEKKRCPYQRQLLQLKVKKRQWMPKKFLKRKFCSWQRQISRHKLLIAK